MGFKKLKGVKLPEEVQGLIRYTCLNYESQPSWMREKIDRLCLECGGEYCAALKDVMCSKKSVTAIRLKYAVSEPTLYRVRKKFYEAWNPKSK